MYLFLFALHAFAWLLLGVEAVVLQFSVFFEIYLSLGAGIKSKLCCHFSHFFDTG